MRKKTTALSDVPNTSVPEHVGFRLDADSREKIAAYMAANHMSRSQAFRVLLALGLKETERMDEVFQRAAFKEGLILGIAKIREVVSGQVEKTLENAEAEVRNAEG